MTLNVATFDGVKRKGSNSKENAQVNNLTSGQNQTQMQASKLRSTCDAILKSKSKSEANLEKQVLLARPSRNHANMNTALLTTLLSYL